MGLGAAEAPGRQGGLRRWGEPQEGGTREVCFLRKYYQVAERDGKRGGLWQSQGCARQSGRRSSERAPVSRLAGGTRKEAQCQEQRAVGWAQLGPWLVGGEVGRWELGSPDVGSLWLCGTLAQCAWEQSAVSCHLLAVRCGLATPSPCLRFLIRKPEHYGIYLKGLY